MRRCDIIGQHKPKSRRQRNVLDAQRLNMSIDRIVSLLDREHRGFFGILIFGQLRAWYHVA